MASRKYLLVAVALLAPLPAFAQSVHRNGFEGRETAWVRGTSDASYKEIAHDVTDQTSPHTGQLCEHIRLVAEKGSFINYYYPVPRAPICEELSASLWLKGNRPGFQLLARLVLPRERDPANLDERLTVMLAGDLYQVASNRWQRLELRRPVAKATEQQQLMRAKFGRNVDFTDAYIDRLVLQVYNGPGLTEFWIDDLEISPVKDSEPAAAPDPKGDNQARNASRTNAPSRGAVELNQDKLTIGGKPFLIRGIRVSDAPLKTLRDAHLNTVWFDYTTPPEKLAEAIGLGFWLVPSLPVASGDPQLASAEQIAKAIARFQAGDAVLFWDLGGGLMEEQKDVVGRAVRAIHTADLQRPIGADVWDGFKPYSRYLDLVGTHRWPLMTMLELPQHYTWLTQRRRLARPGTFTWTWVQTHLPDWFTTLAYERPGSAAFPEPVGPQPEQIRLLTYVALAAGCRGLAFWSDRFLADSHHGRDRLLAMALLNLEMELLEPLLLSADEPAWIDTTQSAVKAAVLRSRTGLGMLVLPMWVGAGAQFVPGQSATPQLKMVVPEVPIGTQAWEVTPVEVRPLQSERVAGGTSITVPEFSLTRAIVFTSDNNPTGLLVRLQDQTRRMRKLAAQWAVTMAQVEIDKVLRVEEELEQMGYPLPDGAALIRDARARLKNAEDFWHNDDFRNAYWEAERALRPLRILMRARWDQAARGLDVPVSSPYAVSFFTLPRHWRFVTRIQQLSPGANVLPDGDFEVLPNRVPGNWVPQEASLDDVEMLATRVTQKPKEGRQCLMLEAKAKKAVGPDGKLLPPPEALERTFLAINSPAVRLQPGTLVRISCCIRIPDGIAASPDGALFYDSAGGEPLAVRVTEKMDWTRFTLYRWVPPSGTVNVTLALTGIGKVYFDDVRIEPLTAVNTVLRPTSRPSPASAGVNASYRR